MMGVPQWQENIQDYRRELKKAAHLLTLSTAFAIA